MDVEQVTSGLRERTRRAVQAEISETAMRLFVEQGFDTTTIDQIAQQAGISRRSFFRYFATKEDVVLGNLADRGRAIQAALVARPADEPAWEALLGAFAVLKGPDYPLETGLRISTMLLETPSLRARHLEKHLEWQALLVPEIQRRLGGDLGPPGDPRAAAIVAAALVCLDVATETWTRAGGEGDIEKLFDLAVAAVRGTAG